MAETTTLIERRAFLRSTLIGMGGALAACGGGRPAATQVAQIVASACVAPGAVNATTCGRLTGLGALVPVTIGPQDPNDPNDADHFLIPPGMTIRRVAKAGQSFPANPGFEWHGACDGMATFATADGGWVLVCNEEDIPGGVGALRFDADGNVVDAYRILDRTRGNCAGGPTPWGTWLSCEEIADGRVYECDPFCRELGEPYPLTGVDLANALNPGSSDGMVRGGRVLPALGAFAHEAVAVDPVNRALYLTEDDGFGRFYRFRPSASDWPPGTDRPALQDGVLEALVIDGVANPNADQSITTPTGISWIPVANPSQTPVSGQVPNAQRFDGGEGCWYQDGLVYFTTKGTNQVWCVNVADPNNETIETLYGPNTAQAQVLDGPDNVTISCFGDVLVAEDGGDLQIVVLTPDGSAAEPLVQLVNQVNTEVTGPCFSPDGSRLYFNSQYGPDGTGPGRTYELSGLPV